MRAREFLDLARAVLGGTTEAHWRGAVIHAYYALMLECRDTLVRWGRAVLPRHGVHSGVRLAFAGASDPDLKSIGDALDELVRRRNKASYDLQPSTTFASASTARTMVQLAADRLALLDAVDSDPARRAAALPP